MSSFINWPLTRDRAASSPAPPSCPHLDQDIFRNLYASPGPLIHGGTSEQAQRSFDYPQSILDYARRQQPKIALPSIGRMAQGSAGSCDSYFNGCWQALAGQVEGSNSGSVGQVTHRVAAVHRLVLCSGDLSTAGGSAAASPWQRCRIPTSTMPKTTHKFS